jgi:hypothetical protein
VEIIDPILSSNMRLKSKHRTQVKPGSTFYLNKMVSFNGPYLDVRAVYKGIDPIPENRELKSF